MRINQESTGNLTALITLELMEEDYIKKVNKQLNDYAKKANIPGFRAGKVPMGMIKKMYFEPLMAETISNMIGEKLEEYIAENNLDILGQPLPNTDKQQIIDFKTEKDFTFFYDIAFKPKVEFELNEKMNVNFYDIEAGDDVVEKYLIDIRSRYGTQSNPEIAEENDVLYGNVVELNKESGIDTKTVLNIKDLKTKALKDNFIGSKKDDKIILAPHKAFKEAQDISNFLNITLEEAKDIKGDFEFTIGEISRIELAELNDELYQKVYEHANITSEEDLRNRIRKDVEETFKIESDRKMMNDVTKLLLETITNELPDEFLKRWILENNASEKEENRITKEQLDIQYESYRDSLRWQLIEEKLMLDFDLKVTKDDIRNRVATLMGIQGFGADDEASKPFIDQIVDSVVKNKEEMKRIADQVMENKLINLFKEKVSLTNKKISYEAFVKLVQEEV
jgi:trigger factor